MDCKHYMGAALLSSGPSQVHDGVQTGDATRGAVRNKFSSRRRGLSGKENARGHAQGGKQDHAADEQGVGLSEGGSIAWRPASCQASSPTMSAVPAKVAFLGFAGASWPATVPHDQARHESSSPPPPPPRPPAAVVKGTCQQERGHGRPSAQPSIMTAASKPGMTLPVTERAEPGVATLTAQSAADSSAQPGVHQQAATPGAGAALLASAAAALLSHRPAACTAAGSLFPPAGSADGGGSPGPTEQPTRQQQSRGGPARTPRSAARHCHQRQAPQPTDPQPATSAHQAAYMADSQHAAAAPPTRPAVGQRSNAQKPAARKRSAPKRRSVKQAEGPPQQAAADTGVEQAAWPNDSPCAAATGARRHARKCRLQRIVVDATDESGVSSCSDAEQALAHAARSGASDCDSVEVEAEQPVKRRKPRPPASGKQPRVTSGKGPAASRKRAAPSAAKGTAAANNAAGQLPTKRRAAEVQWSGITASGKPKAQGKATASVGSQRSNFVRTNMKGGGRFSFKSKSGRGSQKRRGGRFGGRGANFMRQAGEGADYLEGCEGARSQRCFKCGAVGHWAAECRGLEADGEEGPDLPAKTTARVAAAAAARQTSVRPAGDMWSPAGGYQALAADPHEEGLQEVVRNVFGFPGFRGHQLPVVQAVLQGRSTLAIMPTGAGKSLCYQLAAVVGGGTVLVVSPLLALMRDQLAHLPPGLPAAMLSASQPRGEARQVLDDLKAGRLRVLLVAPERLHSAALREALAPLLPLPLVAVDEAHCVTEWGHNFRSAYFRLGHMLRTAVPAKAVLALTATATSATAAAIAETLGIATDAIIRDDSLRPNLRLAVTHINGGSEGGRTKRALLSMLQSGGELAAATSVIVYCTYQAQCSDVAGFLCTRGIVAAAYHAGKAMQEREAVQEAFCGGKLRVVVATVAFGMGLDARGVRAVVHASLPRSPEEYVQHVGRAGRDGEPASCHLFLDDADFLRLRSLAHTDGVDAAAIGSFLHSVFDADTEDGTARQYRVLPADLLAARLDMRREVMETLLSYLEADEQPYLHVLSSTGTSVQAAFYGANATELAEQHPAVAALLRAAGKPRNGCYKAATAELVAEASAPPHQILRQLQELAAAQELRFEVSREPALCFEVLRTPSDVTGLAGALATRTAVAGAAQLSRLDTAYRIFATAATAGPDRSKQEALLRSRIAEYFGQQESPATAAAGVSAATNADEAAAGGAAGASAEHAVPGDCAGQDAEARAAGAGCLAGLPVRDGHSSLALDCRELLAWARSAGLVGGLTARALARILHGLTSPAFPSDRWTRCGVWGRYAGVDFAAVLAACQEVLDAKRLQALAAA